MTTTIFVIQKQSTENDYSLIAGVTDSEEAAADYVNTFNDPDYHSGDWQAWFERFTLNNLPSLKPEFDKGRLKEELYKKLQGLRNQIDDLPKLLSHASAEEIQAVSSEIEACLAKIAERRNQKVT